MKIYLPGEDSFLLSKAIEKFFGKIKDKNSIKFLEVGCGSGIQLETLFKSGIKKENILAVDINPEAVKHCKSIGFNCIKSDLFSKIENKKRFDVIIFNPPYLPEDEFDKEPDTTGGKKGGEIINRFLREAKKHLTQNGFILLITSSHSGEVDFSGYEKELLGTKKLFFEILFLWKLW